MKTSIAVVWIVFLSQLMAQAQTGVTGTATIILEDGGTDCLGAARLVRVYADATGLTGTAGAPAGLNAFVLKFHLDGSINNDFFASAMPGSHPDFSWGFQHTHSGNVETDGFLTVVGWASFPDVPSTQNYHLCTIVLSGTAQNVTFTFDASYSSLGSRVVNPPDGDGPGSIDFSEPSPFSAQILDAFSLQLNDGIYFWLETNPSYDLAAPTGPIDTIDLVKLINCGG